MSVTQTIDVQRLWEKYEDIAMHFNDLLIKLRTQSLAGIAAVSALVGLFSKTTAAEVHMEWTVAEALFIAMGAFWIAVWCLDMLYYNRLLIGAVASLHRLEALTNGKTFDGYIDMSTLIEAEFEKPAWNIKKPRFFGIIFFYLIVFGLIVAGFLFSRHMANAA